MSSGESQWIVGYFDSLHKRLDRDNDLLDKRLEKLECTVEDVKTLVNQVSGGLTTLKFVLAGVGGVGTLALILIKVFNLSITVGD